MYSGTGDLSNLGTKFIRFEHQVFVVQALRWTRGGGGHSLHSPAGVDCRRHVVDWTACLREPSTYRCSFAQSQGGVEKNSWYLRTAFFFAGYPRRRGGGGTKKNLRQIFSGPQNLKFPQLYPTSLGLEGARRIFFKVTIDVSADMGGICVSGHKDLRSVLAAVQRPPWPLIGRPKSGRKCYITPVFSGVPNKGDKIKATKTKSKKFPLCPTSYL